MTHPAYSALQIFLDQFAIGFPTTESGVEFKILESLFTPEEAELAVLLMPIPETPEKIAKRTGREESGLAAKLEEMSRKGLIFRVRRDGKSMYNAAPFMIGIYEYSVDRVDEDLARLYAQYYEEAYQTEMGASNIPGFRVFPVDQTIKTDMSLLPYEKVEDAIRNARKIAVTPCICRREARLAGHGCGHMEEACLSFGVAAEYYIDNGAGREVNADEAMEILMKADAEGLVHAGANVQHLSNICNCCGCCCASMKGILDKGHDKIKYLNALYIPVVDEDLCTACAMCEDRCPVGAILVEDFAQVNPNQCLGCGLCASGCPAEALDMQLRDNRDEPFDRVFDMFKGILEGKEKHDTLSEPQRASLDFLRAMEKR